MATLLKPKGEQRRRQRQMAEARGRAAEDRAAAFFEASGCHVLARRVRTGAGEIDLVAASATTLIFAEVKLRATALAAAESLRPLQCRRLAGAAEIILARHPDWLRDETRFDVVLISKQGLLHLPDAFRPE
ncbi:MAG TPA: YraN family protein [Acetobacteraceae bacterium]|nr:YraN family protein [Acetobacteraceae bacterium]